MSTKRKISYALVSVILTFLILVLILELSSFIICSVNNVPLAKIGYVKYPSARESKYFGYTLRSNFKNNVHKKFLDGKTIYNVVYTTDFFKRRTVGVKHIDTNQHMLLFGGSFTYGEGLQDQETLQYFLQKQLSGCNIYNYAVFGYGPQHMLAILEKDDISKEVKSNEGVALYVFIEDHLYRAIPSTRYPGLFSSPYYYLNNNNVLTRKESFITGERSVINFYGAFLNMKSKSYFLTLANINFPLKLSKRHIVLTSEIIIKSQQTYMKKFDGKFYVLIHPLENINSKNVQYLIKLLRKNNVEVLFFPLGKVKTEYIIFGDGHPNYRLNAFLANKLSQQLSF